MLWSFCQSSARKHFQTGKQTAEASYLRVYFCTEQWHAFNFHWVENSFFFSSWSSKKSIVLRQAWKSEPIPQCFYLSCIANMPINTIKVRFFHHNKMFAQSNKTPTYVSPPGFLRPRASLHPSQPLQTGLCWWQQGCGTSVCAPVQFHISWLGHQCDSSLCLASSQLPQAACISRGPVLCGGVPVSWFHMWARSLPLHQQQGSPARVSRAGQYGKNIIRFFHVFWYVCSDVCACVHVHVCACKSLAPPWCKQAMTQRADTTDQLAILTFISVVWSAWL